MNCGTASDAARLQYEQFSDIHSYLTTWIAGYSSDAVVRQKFGSSLSLFQNVKEYSLEEKSNNYSWADIKRNIKIPLNLSEDLAEETGIHLGDGNLHISLDKNGWYSYRYMIAGNLTEETMYHQEYIQPLLRRLYGFKGVSAKRKENNEIDTILSSKSVVLFKQKSLGLPVGSKTNAIIPRFIFQEDSFMKKCLVGIFDTDFTIKESISLAGSLTSVNVIRQMDKMLVQLKIKHKTIYKDNFGKIYIPQNEAGKIIEEWGLHNIKHTSKYHLWQEYKKYIPYSTTVERLAILNGKLDIGNVEEICKKRKINGLGRARTDDRSRKTAETSFVAVSSSAVCAVSNSRISFGNTNISESAPPLSY